VPTTLAPNPAPLPLRAAIEARDLAAAVAAFAPDAVVRSPLTDRLTFTGPEQIGAVLQILLASFEDLHYTDELRHGDQAVLVAHARVAGQELELVDHLRLGPDGRIRELTVFFRPLPAAATALRVFGAGLGRRRSAWRAATISGLARPLGFLARSGDALGARLVRRALS
jgi:hypothetical protein